MTATSSTTRPCGLLSAPRPLTSALYSPLAHLQRHLYAGSGGNYHPGSTSLTLDPVKRHPRQEGVPTPLPQSEVRHRHSATCPVEASVQYRLMATGPTLQDVLACSGSRRELGAGAYRHRPEERPTIRRLAAGRPAIPGTVQERPVDEACAETLPLYFRGERDFRNDAPLALMTDLPHQPRIGYPVTAVDANILKTSRPRRGVQQEEPLGPRTAKKHPPPTKLIQPVRCPHRSPLASPLPSPSLTSIPTVVLQTIGTATSTTAGLPHTGRKTAAAWSPHDSGPTHNYPHDQAPSTLSR
jgi:hypothetical protein